MMRSQKIAASSLLGLLLALASPPALASTTFPEALRKKLGLEQIAGPAPGCRLCHRDDLGGLKTATKPLARSLLQAGAMGGSVPSLLGALTTLESENTDSDADGIGDIAELKAGTDPNVGLNPDGTPSATEEIPLPETGCTLGAARATSGAWLLLCAACVLLRLRRQR
jgi:hypothetical protein